MNAVAVEVAEDQENCRLMWKKICWQKYSVFVQR